jgi:cytochrome b involved in lipid metabolism
MQKRLLVSGVVLILILGIGYGVMQFTNNEESSSAGMTTGTAVTADVVQKEAATPIADQASTTTTEVVAALTATEVSRHATESDCWIIVNNGVYNVTQYVPQHPGGKGKIVPLCGKDATRAFEGEHGGDRKPETMLAKLKIGDLQK